jgi:hypothetical protein
VHFDSDSDDLPLVHHDTQVDLNPGGARIRYTQESTVVAESSLSSPQLYIIAGQRTGVGRNKVLIPNPDYKGKGHMESVSSNPALRMEMCCTAKIRGPPVMMVFSDDDTEEE